MNKFPVATYAQGNPQAEKLALFLPGLLDSKDYPHMRSHVDFFGRLGFYALAVDMPGTWESGGSIDDFTTTNCLAAIKAIITTADKPTFVFGHSNGGRLAALAAAENPQITAIAIAMSATTTYNAEKAAKWQKDGVKVSYRDLPDNPEQTRQYDLAFAFYEDAQRYDAPKALGTLQIPKLFIFGRHDTLVPPDDVWRTFRAAADPKYPVSFYVDHDYRRDPRAVDRMNAIVHQFLLLHRLLPGNL